MKEDVVNKKVNSRPVKTGKLVSADGRATVKLGLYKFDDGWYRWIEKKPDGTVNDTGLMARKKSTAVELLSEVTYEEMIPNIQ